MGNYFSISITCLQYVRALFSIMLTLTVFIFFESSIQASSPAKTQSIAQINEIKTINPVDAGRETLKFNEQFFSDRLGDFIKLPSSVSINSQPITKEEAEKERYKREDWLTKYLIKKLPHIESLSILLFVRVFLPFCIGILLGYMNAYRDIKYL